MARSKREWTQAKYERYLDVGRGQGEGKNYVPWIKVQDFPSEGRSHRIPGWKTGRVHHLLSDQEKRTFFLFEWSDIVIDIREQYPLADLDLALKIADEMNFKYPEDPQHHIPYILSTDFMITIERDGKPVQVARTVKLSKDLEKKSVVEKLELERRYYEALNIDWGIITEKGISRMFASNVEWIHPNYHLEPTGNADLVELRRIANILKDQLSRAAAENTPITKITTDLDREMNLDPGIALYLFKHLVARKEIIVDMLNSKISSNLSTTAIQKIREDSYEE
ncbi:TnsA endonuclease C-terminal domain-containing protein [Limnoraphis robusta Tam1]|uniref:TnsA endonuclease C-terminal domain-containing protein n=1 Tax=Limnoraphis robusta TaxID=1118279 RepID=UPI002B220D49|nr:TnsA endonuclease C-terminal domain-containing protein [Limnoraphis robusta]MEA5498337.1 TnsA endonuclease C-terminal domain-containing protein [Limnoraphis robusta BA-68 BA1]MEA5540361.1 TnsA endonuclease C-terminal domain-containing protein [Limnoraphis robusta Tam1]